VIALSGLCANADPTLKEAAENPGMGPFTILGLITRGRLNTPKDFLDAANFWKIIKTSDITILSGKFVKQGSMVQMIVKASMR
jgi:hypothetical protein